MVRIKNNLEITLFLDSNKRIKPGKSIDITDSEYKACSHTINMFKSGLEITLIDDKKKVEPPKEAPPKDEKKTEPPPVPKENKNPEPSKEDKKEESK